MEAHKTETLGSHIAISATHNNALADIADHAGPWNLDQFATAWSALAFIGHVYPVGSDDYTRVLQAWETGKRCENPAQFIVDNSVEPEDDWDQ